MHAIYQLFQTRITSVAHWYVCVAITDANNLLLAQSLLNIIVARLRLNSSWLAPSMGYTMNSEMPRLGLFASLLTV